MCDRCTVARRVRSLAVSRDRAKNTNVPSGGQDFYDHLPTKLIPNRSAANSLLRNASTPIEILAIIHPRARVVYALSGNFSEASYNSTSPCYALTIKSHSETTA